MILKAWRCPFHGHDDPTRESELWRGSGFRCKFRVVRRKMVGEQRAWRCLSLRGWLFRWVTLQRRVGGDVDDGKRRRERFRFYQKGPEKERGKMDQAA